MTNVVYTIVIPGAPIPLARPRLGKWGVYDSQKILKKRVAHCLLQQKGTWQKVDGAVGMYFEFHMPLPASISQKKAGERLKAYHIQTPDLSNMIKFYEDVLQGHIYDNDSQIVEILAKKVNSVVGETIIKYWRIPAVLPEKQKEAGS